MSFYYEYDYHDLAQDADYIDQDDTELCEDDQIEHKEWENYYHNLAEEIDD